MMVALCIRFSLLCVLNPPFVRLAVVEGTDINDSVQMVLTEAFSTEQERKEQNVEGNFEWTNTSSFFCLDT